jgi:hypothetical protein
LAIVESVNRDEETAFSLASAFGLALLVETVVAVLEETAPEVAFSFVVDLVASAATVFFFAEPFLEGAFVATMG